MNLKIQIFAWNTHVILLFVHVHIQGVVDPVIGDFIIAGVIAAVDQGGFLVAKDMREGSEVYLMDAVFLAVTFFDQLDQGVFAAISNS